MKRVFWFGSLVAMMLASCTPDQLNQAKAILAASKDAPSDARATPTSLPPPSATPAPPTPSVPGTGSVRVLVLDGKGNFVPGAGIAAKCISSGCNYLEFKSTGTSSVVFSGIPIGSIVEVGTGAFPSGRVAKTVGVNGPDTQDVVLQASEQPPATQTPGPVEQPSPASSVTAVPKDQAFVRVRLVGPSGEPIKAGTVYLRDKYAISSPYTSAKTSSSGDFLFTDAPPRKTLTATGNAVGYEFSPETTTTWDGELKEIALKGKAIGQEPVVAPKSGTWEVVWNPSSDRPYKQEIHLRFRADGTISVDHEEPSSRDAYNWSPGKAKFMAGCGYRYPTLRLDFSCDHYYMDYSSPTQMIGTMGYSSSSGGRGEMNVSARLLRED